MAYSFRLNDASVQDGLRRIASDQIKTAIAEIDDPDLPTPVKVHQVRKRCKKLRGLIRLVRPGFDGYSDENAVFRDAARRLSDLRDSKVLIDTYDMLMEHFAGEVNRREFASIRRRLTLNRQARKEDDSAAEKLSAFRGEMCRALDRAKDWKVEERGFEVLAAGIRKTYKRARKAMTEADDKRTGEALHEWRKRVKYHRYHTRLLKRMWPEEMEMRADEAGRLSDLLGDHHDLVVFAQTLQETPDAFGRATVIEAAVGLAEARKGELEDEAFALGNRLFAEPKSAVTDRWRVWWRAWRAVREPA